MSLNELTELSQIRLGPNTDKVRYSLSHSLSTNFRLELIEPSPREVFNFWTLVEREDRRGRAIEEGEENMAHT